MAEDKDNGNVIPFEKPQAEPRPKRDWQSLRHKPDTPQFQHHDAVVRFRLRGLVREESFVRWMVEEATNLHLDGWARSRGRENELEVLLAGQVGDVKLMLEHLREGPRPVDMLLVEEKPLKGDEPLWSGFHHLAK